MVFRSRGKFLNMKVTVSIEGLVESMKREDDVSKKYVRTSLKIGKFWEFFVTAQEQLVAHKNILK